MKETKSDGALSIDHPEYYKINGRLIPEEALPYGQAPEWIEFCL